MSGIDLQFMEEIYYEFINILKKYHAEIIEKY